MNYADVSELYTYLFKNDSQSNILTAIDILITTNTLYHSVAQIISGIGKSIHRVIIDEIDSVGMYTIEPIPADATWLVSASAHLTKEGFFKQFVQSTQNTIKCDPEFIAQSIKLPHLEQNNVRCSSIYAGVLRAFGIDPIDIYANNFTKYVFKHHRHSTGRKCMQEFSKALIEDHVTELQGVVAAIADAESAEEPDNGLITSLKERRSALANQIRKSLIRVQDRCALCLGDQPSVRTTCCSHALCARCAEPREICLLCAYSGQTFTPVQQSAILGVLRPDKVDEVCTILTQELSAQDPRILIFSDFYGLFLVIAPILESMNVKYKIVEGSVHEIETTLKDYKSGSFNVLLVDGHHYGAGMNLQMTSSIILFHFTSKRSQIIGRAQRLGRTGALRVYELRYPEEIRAA
ncbi:hypothetical protein M427DRAFT_50045 [Gonapodya prolifera JEL478]|uniref:Helicase C-terminal domain-containing protein n=1 Tax=Gonapodya prolifera (strain JEL478) TaxID=1344416 RepID=A0A138ZXM6_GONPJ|nr:hypothetical protein M427DRAFT_50045 [Gonapodya prolifera JEL478]|eukprot:KXS09055.1 hypothetical protein M427DRAFT_50045 [Gonapodya prolifera JEL478]